MLPRKKARPNPAISAANNDSQTLVSNSTTEAPTSQSQASKASPAVEADHNNNAKAPSTQQIMDDPGSTAQHKSKDVRLPTVIPFLVHSTISNNTSRFGKRRAGTVPGNDPPKPRHLHRSQRKTFLEGPSS